jgi:hypothetical protein
MWNWAADEPLDDEFDAEPKLADVVCSESEFESGSASA